MKKIGIFLMLTFAAGCASVSVQRYYKDVTFPATHPANIIIYMAKPEGRAFTEIGEITVEGASEWSQIERVFRNKAAEMGGEAVYIFDKKETTRQYVTPDECYVHYGYYYPYHHFGWGHYRPNYYYPSGYYYCYGYPGGVETATYISAVGIVVRYK